TDLKAQMQQAQNLIRAVRYDEARTLLNDIDHPVAEKWLKKLDAVAPEQEVGDDDALDEEIPAPPPRIHEEALVEPVSKTSSGRQIILSLILLVVLVSVPLGVGFLMLSGVIPFPEFATFASPTQVREVVSSDGSDDEDAEIGATTVRESTPTLVVLMTETATQTPDADSITPEATSENSDTDNLTPEAVDDSDDSDTAPAAVRSGLRVPFVNGIALFRVDMLEGWICECGVSYGLLQVEGNAAKTIDVNIVTQGFDPSIYVGMALTDVLAQELTDDDILLSQTLMTVDGRNVLEAMVTTAVASDKMEARYYVNDSDGQVIQLTSFVSDAETLALLTDEMLLLAGTIEAEVGDTALDFTTEFAREAVAYNAELNRWRLNDASVGNREHTVEVPEGWIIRGNVAGNALAIKADDAVDSRTEIVILQDVDDLAESQPEAEPIDSNGRVVYYLDSEDDGIYRLENTYVVQDSDGDVLGLVIQPGVDDEVKATLREDLVFMGGNVESEPVDYITRLARAGLIEDVDIPDDGYIPVADF
ncbi:MAG: hypothetical protein ACPG7F_19745, partial [Aggregatilineales bacterium]